MAAATTNDSSDVFVPIESFTPLIIGRSAPFGKSAQPTIRSLSEIDWPAVLKMYDSSSRPNRKTKELEAAFSTSQIEMGSRLSMLK